MKSWAVALVIAAFAVSATTGALTYVSYRRTSTMTARIEKLEKESVLLDAFEEHESIERTDSKALFERVETLESVAVADIKRRAQTSVTRSNPPAPAPAVRRPTTDGGWWCYLGRECWRSPGECIADDETRKSECRHYARAWCGGRDGRTCFVDNGDCFYLQIDGGKNCVQVE